LIPVDERRGPFTIIFNGGYHTHPSDPGHLKEGFKVGKERYAEVNMGTAPGPGRASGQEKGLKIGPGSPSWYQAVLLIPFSAA
jgi:hypothetical protein